MKTHTLTTVISSHDSFINTRINFSLFLTFIIFIVELRFLSTFSLNKY